ncbi:MAG: branched-chain amino acid ABC transporter permease [Devosiaceae bacterium]|nr:branched-chain amino acid ABC transporter permease [Devosiaceae bacterium]
MFSIPKKDAITFLLFALVVLTMPIWLSPFGASYPGLLQKFAIYALLAVGYNILFGLTGYLSFGHAAFLGVGSYAAVWSFKLLSMNPILALAFAMIFSGIFALAIGYVSLRRSGIYFSILTLAFAQMSYKLAYSVLSPITHGENGLQFTLQDPRTIDLMFMERGVSLPTSSLFGIPMNGYEGFYFCAVILLIGFFIAQKIASSPFGMMLKGIKSNEDRMNYTGFNTKPYMLTAFVISGMYAGIAGGLLAVTDPLAGAERMQWTASGELVLMTILGGVGTLVGPVIGAWIIKYFENIFSAWNESILHNFFAFLPDNIEGFVVLISSKFVGEGWHLTLGLMFVLVVVFLPGGIMEGVRRISSWFLRRKDPTKGQEVVDPENMPKPSSEKGE